MGPSGPLRLFRRRMMGKTSSKAPDPAEAKALVVLGVDEHEKPRAARFSGSNPALVAKAAEAMGLRLVEVASEEHAELIKKLPIGRLYSNGKGFVPYVRRDLFTKVATALGVSPAAVTAEPPRLPRSWDDIG